MPSEFIRRRCGGNHPHREDLLPTFFFAIHVSRRALLHNLDSIREIAHIPCCSRLGGCIDYDIEVSISSKETHTMTLTNLECKDKCLMTCCIQVRAVEEEECPQRTDNSKENPSLQGYIKRAYIF